MYEKNRLITAMMIDGWRKSQINSVFSNYEKITKQIESENTTQADFDKMVELLTKNFDFSLPRIQKITCAKILGLCNINSPDIKTLTLCGKAVTVLNEARMKRSNGKNLHHMPLAKSQY